jgi:predicted porin
MYNVKKSLVLAVGATLSTVSMWAAADVKVGGMAQVEIAREETKSAAGVTTKRTTVEDNTRGRFWITADENLGGGMKGLAYYEFSVDTTGVCAVEGTTPFGTCGAAPVNQNTREKYVGLQTNMGTVKLGSNRNPNQFLGGVYWDAFVTTNLEARGNGGMSGTTFGHIGYLDNSLRYESPTWGGFGFEFAYVFDDAATTASTTDDGDYAIGGQWKGKIPGGNLHAVAVHTEDANNSAGAAGDNNNRAQSKLGARYDFLKDYSIMGQYETIDNDANTLDQKIYYLGFQARFGKVLGAVQWGKTKDDITHNDTDYLAVGAWYSFSKTFRAIGGYRQTETDNGNQDKIFSAALLKLF